MPVLKSLGHKDFTIITGMRSFNKHKRMPTWDNFNALVVLNKHGHLRFFFQNWISHMINIQWTNFERKYIVSFISEELPQLNFLFVETFSAVGRNSLVLTALLLAWIPFTDVTTRDRSEFVSDRIERIWLNLSEWNKVNFHKILRELKPLLATVAMAPRCFIDWASCLPVYCGTHSK